MLDNIFKIIVSIAGSIYIIQTIVSLIQQLQRNFAKQHYSNKIQIIKKKILDVEFLVEEYKMTREGFRTEYDRMKEMQDACVVRTEEENKKEDKDKDVIAQLKKLKEKYDPDILKLQKQMETIDLQIDGPLPNGQ